MALLFAAVWNSAVCFVASVTSSLADARVFLPMERIDTLGVAGSKTGRVMTAVRVMRKTARVEDMMCPGRGTGGGHVAGKGGRCVRRCQHETGCAA